MTKPDDEHVSVGKERIEQLQSAMAFALADRSDDPAATVNVSAEDDFGQLEAAFQIFLSDLAEARGALERALAEMEASRNELQGKLMMIEQQRLTIRELSTPILDLWEGVLTLPVVGVIDTQRAVEMTERLLGRVVETGARWVILDITGVEIVDTSTADHLVRLTRAAGLLGTRCIVTGIGPNVARTLVAMGVDLGGVRTLRTLRDGLRACLDEVGMRQVSGGAPSEADARAQGRHR
jgi:rsbT co-antagonist protein RsbR